MAFFRKAIARRTTILPALVIFLAQPSWATEARKLDVPADSKWQHAATQVIVPPTLAGLSRTEISDTTQDELDVMLQFRDPGADILTLYIYRPRLNNLALWFDRSETQILTNPLFGTAMPTSDAAIFASPRSLGNNAVRRVYKASQSPFKATGLALLELGDWLLAVRFSSRSLDPQMVDTKLLEIINGIGLPAQPARADPALILDCPDQIRFAKKARLKKSTAGTALFGALGARLAEEGRMKAKVGTELCRDGAPDQAFSVYREIGNRQRYTIAVSDAGRSIDVSPAISLSGEQSVYAVTFNDLAASDVYRQFDRLPGPAQVIELVQTTMPVSSASGDGKNITIGGKPE